MFLSNAVSGLIIGVPIMLAVGPIAILLVDQGLERGTRTAAPAALGVASADLSFSVIAAIGGTSITVLLTPITPVLSVAAVGLLFFLAVRLFRASTAELRVLRAVPAASAHTGPVAEPCLAGVGDRTAFADVLPLGEPAGSTLALDTFDGTVDDAAGPVTDDAAGPATEDAATLATEDAATLAASDSTGIPFGHLSGLRLGAAFFGLTVVNPLTVVLFAAVVVAGGSGVGTPGWAIGMGLSSLIVHGGWVLLGGALGSTLGQLATARMRLGASVLMAALALHFLLA